VDDYASPHAVTRVVDAFAAGLNFGESGFRRAVAAAAALPGYHPSDMLRLISVGGVTRTAKTIPFDAGQHGRLFEMIVKGTAWHHWRTILPEGHYVEASW
jgi:hypothetical protein